MTSNHPARRGLSLVFSLAMAFGAGHAFAEARTLDTAYGPVTVDGDAERVVTLYEGALDSAYAVGVEPVGAIMTRGGDGVATYLQDRADGINIVGTARETNLEAVVALQPDIILASSRLPKEQYDLLSKVAPTLVPTTSGFKPDNWRAEAEFFAKALDKEDEMQQALTDVDAHIAEVAQTVEARIPADERDAVLARWMPQGPLIMASTLFSTGLLEATGFTVGDAGAVKANRPHSSPLSQENLNLMDGDWLFLATLNTEGRDALAAAEKSPAYNRLSVVEKGHVIPVDGQIWTSATGPLAAQSILDTIESQLPDAR
ncbi:ABC transporter substrate-binding protein [Marinobacter sp. JSM 1782161]|uniref:ABC transporter substrate-binding protein n=1 Tax=Marinobacter sp. JSM 1782161 TaxID=2685906 RepID=UPI0014033BB9|nr:iron-siderophore ABC transporter substrate-binding protein [Marinobacter sp. JSM 1782161]